MVIKGIPRTERIWVRRLTEKGEVFYTTSKDIRDFYFLYKIENDLDTAKKPLKSGCGFRSYAEAFDVLLCDRAETERFISAVELIYGKDQVEKCKSAKEVAKIREEVSKRVKAVKLGKSKFNIEPKQTNNNYSKIQPVTSCYIIPYGQRWIVMIREKTTIETRPRCGEIWMCNLKEIAGSCGIMELSEIWFENSKHHVS